MRQNNIAPYMSNDIRDNKPTTTSLNAEAVRNEYRGVRYSNQNAYTGGGTGTGSYDFGSVDLTGSGGGGGMDDSLRIDQGIPVTKRNPMLRKNVVSYGCGGKHRSPYKYSDGGIHNQYSRPNIYDQGGMMDPQDGNGAYWQDMAARIGQQNADIALLQTQKIIAGNGKGNPYQMPEQRNMMPNAQFDQGGTMSASEYYRIKNNKGGTAVNYKNNNKGTMSAGYYYTNKDSLKSSNQGNAINREVKSRYDEGGMLEGNDNSIRGLISSAMQDVNAQMMPAPQKRRFTSGGRF